MAQKHGQEVRNGVFQVGSGPAKQCFEKSFLQKDKHFRTLDKSRNADKITNIYTTLPVGPVRVDQLHLFYDKYLRSDNIDLVVFSKTQDDGIVYDSRLDQHQNLHRLTNNVIFLWLNDGHYDLILSPYTFSRCCASAYCFECMQYFR